MQTKKIGLRIALIAVLLVYALSLVLIIGTSSSWGKVKLQEMDLLSGDGDRIHALLYKPVEANADNQVPLAILAHGGSDMQEQMSSYAIELSRRGYAVLALDEVASASSDVATGNADPYKGLGTVWNTVKNFNFVNLDRVVTMGHSMGGMYTVNYAVDHPEDVFLQINLGMNMYGSADIHEHNFNFINILGDSDESALARAVGDTNWNHFQVEQLKRIFYNDYETAAEDLPELILNQKYTVTGSDGNEYIRIGYMPDSCHAYYLVDQDAIKTVVYAVTSTVGLGLDEGVASYDDVNKISTVWQWHDIGYALELIAMIGMMTIVTIWLVDLKLFAGLRLRPMENVGYKKFSWQWFVALALLLVLPPALYATGKLPQNDFLGIPVNGLWLLDGNVSAWLCWQWLLSLVLIAFFLIYHFTYGRKHGGCARNYGLATSDTGRFSLVYLVKAALFGLLVVGSGYLMMAFATHWTHQGLHIMTFMIRPLEANRTFIAFIYFLYLIPYFLSGGLVGRTLGLTGDGSNKQTWKNVAIMTTVSIIGLLILWIVFAVQLNVNNTILPMFKVNRLYILGVGIIPMVIGIGVGNLLNTFVSQKTNSLWPGLFTALLWGTWTISATTAVLRYFF